MTRKRAADGTAAPKAPRVRKKKADQEPKHEPSVYDPIIGSGMMMDDAMYTQDYGYAFGSQPPFPGDGGHSPFLMPAQSSTPQPQLMMRGMPPGGPQQAGVMAGGPPPGQTLGPAPTVLEFRIHEMNRRLYTFSTSGISEKDYTQWWDAFSHEFFEDDARMYVTLHDEHLPHAETFPLSRQMIPRFFRSFVESGVKDLYYVIRAPSRETVLPNGLILFENENILQITRLDRPCIVEARTECKLTIEFTPFDESMNNRIRLWCIELRSSQEAFLNDITKEYQTAPHDMEKPMSITRLGLTTHTINNLNLTRILEPMQMLMSQSKSNGNMDPKDTLQRTMFEQYSKMNDMNARMGHQQSMMPPNPIEEAKPKPQRKRTRKPAANAKNKKANASPAPVNPAFQPNIQGNFPSMGYQDVMVVGEPTLMGPDFGEEDERTISRVENAQYDPNAMQMQQAMVMQPGAGMMGGPLPMGHQMGPPPNGMPPHSMGGPMGGVPNGPPSMVHMGQPPNGMPPPYNFAQPQAGAWPGQPPNTTMITG